MDEQQILICMVGLTTKKEAILPINEQMAQLIIGDIKDEHKNFINVDSTFFFKDTVSFVQFKTITRDEMIKLNEIYSSNT